MAEQQKPIPDVMQLTDFLTTLENGDFARAAGVELRSVVSALAEAKEGGDTEPGGSLTMTLSFKLTENGIVQVLGKIAGKHPTPPRKKSVFFATKDGGLSRRHPDQLDMLPQDGKKPGLKVS